MITQSHVNQVIAINLDLTLTQSIHLDYLVKRALISDEPRIFLSRNQTVAKLPVIFNRLDSAYRSLRELESVGAIEVFSTGKIDVIEVSPEILSKWLPKSNQDHILYLFMQDLKDYTPPHTEPSVPKKKKRLISNKVKQVVFERDKYRCQNCDTHLNLSIDHIQPESRGGDESMDNLQTLCITCNKSKGTKTMDEWLGGAK